MKHAIQSIGRWSITYFYWAFLTKSLIASEPAALVGGNENITWMFDPSAMLPSFFLHLTSYAILAGLLVWCIHTFQWDRIGLWLGLAVLHAIGFEYLQYYIPKRWPYWLDALANCMGIFLVLAVITAFYQRKLNQKIRVETPLRRTGT